MKQFRYDKEKLELNEVKVTFGVVLKKSLRFLLATLGLALIYYVIFALLTNSDQEKQMIRENKAIEQEYQTLIEKVERLDNVIENLQTRDKQVYGEIFNSEPPTFYTKNNRDSLYSLDIDTTKNEAINQYVASKIITLETSFNQTDSLLKEINSLVSSDSISFTSYPSIIPIEGFSLAQTGATIGKKIHPYYKTLVMHNGIDLITSTGTAVIASADGVVTEVSKSQKGKGNHIKIDHNNGYITTYSHLADIRVRKGQRVKQKTQIGRVGSTGLSFAPHLHYEVLLNGVYQDPINYFFADLTPDSYKEMILTALNTGQSMD